MSDSKIIKVRKDHVCDTCHLPVIKIGDQAEYQEMKIPKYDDNDNQVGIEFLKFYMCMPCRKELDTDIDAAITSIMVNNCIDEVKGYQP